jgi:glycosyltransferase involved in cell wall biosynthesis
VEVLVVADGCTDGSEEMLNSYKAPYPLGVVGQKGQGAAAARNTGAASGKGKLLLFLDDDVVPTTGLIEAHVSTHQTQPGRVVLGPYPTFLQGKTDFINIQKRLWWSEKFQAIRQPHHRYTYRDMLSGNFSIEADLFDRLGGFDAAIKNCGGEDYEFGVRIIKAGILFACATEAIAYHYDHETTDLDRLFRRCSQEGRAEVHIGRRHPDMIPTLGLGQFEKPNSRAERIRLKLAWDWPAVGDFLAARLRGILDLLERLRMRGFWLKLFGELHRYWYWRGVKEELGGRQALSVFLQDGPVHADENAREIELDLSQGLELAMHQLDALRPATARIRYGQHIVGRISPQPGAERLRGVHLRPILANHLPLPLLKALAVEKSLGVAEAENRLL